MKRIGILGLLLMSLMFTCCTAWADGGNAYAVVHNPDAADRLNLRAAPNREAESLGKYYNGVGDGFAFESAIAELPKGI